jgi:hypothetical protein
VKTNLVLLVAIGATAVTASIALAPDGYLAAAQSRPVADNGPPVLVELFTSQGCSSCPPADRVLEKINLQTAVVAISRPVTYWDRLGWKDTLARPANDVRQRRYAARGLPGGGVYTPEAVVQARQAVVGSDERQLRRLIAGARTDQQTTLTQAGGRVTASRAAPGSELNFIAVAARRDVGIKAGENGQRRLGYTNVVLNEMAVACSPKLACSATIPARIANQPGADRWAVVLQRADHGSVEAVRWISRTAK